MKTRNCSRQDAKSAKFGSLISLRPLRPCSGHALRFCGRYSDFWFCGFAAQASVVKISSHETRKNRIVWR